MAKSYIAFVSAKKNLPHSSPTARNLYFEDSKSESLFLVVGKKLTHLHESTHSRRHSVESPNCRKL